MGKSYVGMRTDDVLAWAAFLRTKAESPDMTAVAIGEAAIPALHAATLSPGQFRSVTLRRMIPDWQALTGAGETFDQTVNMVHGALRHYDLPDLIELVGKDRVRIEEPVDGMGEALKR